jgi:hypothetical protein
MHSPVEAGDGEVHGGGEEVDGGTNTRSSTGYFGLERNSGGWGISWYGWFAWRRTEHGGQRRPVQKKTMA